MVFSVFLTEYFRISFAKKDLALVSSSRTNIFKFFCVCIGWIRLGTIYFQKQKIDFRKKIVLNVINRNLSFSRKA